MGPTSADTASVSRGLLQRLRARFAYCNAKFVKLDGRSIQSENFVTFSASHLADMQAQFFASCLDSDALRAADDDSSKNLNTVRQKRYILLARIFELESKLKVSLPFLSDRADAVCGRDCYDVFQQLLAG